MSVLPLELNRKDRRASSFGHGLHHRLEEARLVVAAVIRSLHDDCLEHPVRVASPDEESRGEVEKGRFENPSVRRSFL